MRNPMADDQLNFEPDTPEKCRHAQVQGYEEDVDMSTFLAPSAVCVLSGPFP
jgi:hypothetical protein